MSDVCLSVTYIGPKSRTEGPRKTKIGTEVAHVTLKFNQLAPSDSLVFGAMYKYTYLLFYT